MKEGSQIHRNVANETRHMANERPAKRMAPQTVRGQGKIHGKRSTKRG